MRSATSSSTPTGSPRSAPKAQTCYAASRNKGPILEVLQDLIKDRSSTNVLEIASGTGEHAAHFCSNLNNLVYQTSALNYEAESSWRDKYSKKTSMDLLEIKEAYYDMNDSMRGWAADCSKDIKARGSVILPNIQIDVETFDQSVLPSKMGPEEVDVMICINMIHISAWKCTDALFRTADICCREDGLLLTYGPYSESGEMMDSNKAFNESLKSRNPDWGVRDVDDVEAVAKSHGFYLDTKITMPANNLSLVFRRSKKKR